MRDTHFLFLAPVFFRVDKKLTINTWLEICGTGKKMPHPKFSSFRSGPWWCEKWFADKTCDLVPTWYLMPILPPYPNRTYFEQRDMIPSHYRHAAAIEEVTKIILFCKKNGCYPSPQFASGRCREKIEFETEDVTVGNFEDGVFVGAQFQDIKYKNMGICLYRQP